MTSVDTQARLAALASLDDTDSAVAAELDRHSQRTGLDRLNVARQTWQLSCGTLPHWARDLAAEHGRPLLRFVESLDAIEGQLPLEHDDAETECVTLGLLCDDGSFEIANRWRNGGIPAGEYFSTDTLQLWSGPGHVACVEPLIDALELHARMVVDLFASWEVIGERGHYNNELDNELEQLLENVQCPTYTHPDRELEQLADSELLSLWNEHDGDAEAIADEFVEFAATEDYYLDRDSLACALESEAERVLEELEEQNGDPEFDLE